MTRKSTFLVFLAAFSCLCQAAPLSDATHRDFSSSASSSSTSPHSSSVSSQSPSTSAMPQQKNYADPSSFPPPLPVTDFSLYSNGTIGHKVSEFLSALGNNATDRWITAEISSTMIASADSAGSNKDLSEQVDLSFPSGPARWVDTYVDFLVAAGRVAQDNSSVTAEEVDDLYEQKTNAMAKFAAEELKLFKAYEASHPGNVTYVGVNIKNVSLIEPITLSRVRYWGGIGGDAICAVGNVNDTSSRDSANVTSEDYGTSVIAEIKNCTFNGTSPYTEKDYARYSATAQAVMALNAKIDTYDDTSQIYARGEYLKKTLSEFGVFNLSMDTGPNESTQYVPAYAVNVTASTNGPAQQILGLNMEDDLRDSTVNETETFGGMRRRNGIANGGQVTGFSALQAVAQHVKAPSRHSSAAPPHVVGAIASSVPSMLANDLRDDQTLVLLTVQEGSWADKRDDYIKFAQAHVPDIANQYFGPANSRGIGPIGRHWTHIMLIMSLTGTNGSMDVAGVQVLGKVWDVLLK